MNSFRWPLSFALLIVGSAFAQTQPDEEPELLTLARKHFARLAKDPEKNWSPALTPSEEILIRLTAEGGVADYTDYDWQPEGNPELGPPYDKNYPGIARTWGPNRVLRSDVISWICANREPRGWVAQRPLRIVGARVEGPLSLTDSILLVPIHFVKCQMMDDIRLVHSKIRSILLDGSHIWSLDGESMQVDGGVYCRWGFVANGPIRLQEITVEGSVDFSGAKCWYDGGYEDPALNLSRAKVGRGVFLNQGFEAIGNVSLALSNIGADLICDGGRFLYDRDTSLFLDSLTVKGSISLGQGFVSMASVGIALSKINGSLIAIGGRFLGEKVDSIYADNSVIDGNVFFNNGFGALGTVSLVNTSIGGVFRCDNGGFYAKNGTSIRADGMRTGGSVWMTSGFKADGAVILSGASIGGDLTCDGGQFSYENGYEASAFFAPRMTVSGSLFLRGNFESKGGVTLDMAEIAGDLRCDGAKLNVASGKAFSAEGIRVRGNVFLGDNFEASGLVSLKNATISGNLECFGGVFRPVAGWALDCTSIKVERSVHLSDGFLAVGQVALNDAKVGGNLNCQGARFQSDRDYTLYLDGAEIGGAVFFRKPFECIGGVNLISATIGSNLECDGARFLSNDSFALRADATKISGNVYFRENPRVQGIASFANANIAQTFQWREIESPADSELWLTSAYVHELWDDSTCWPNQGRIDLHNFVYDAIAKSAPFDSKSRLDWLRLQESPDDDPDLGPPRPRVDYRFSPQPYEQLAFVLQRQGFLDDARRIQIAKERDRDWFIEMSFLGNLWRGVIRHAINYGYEPWQVWPYVVAFIGVGAMLFRIGKSLGVMAPVNEKAYLPETGEWYDEEGMPQVPIAGSDSKSVFRRVSGDQPKFSAFLYSLDEFLPLINLRQGDYWIPNVNVSKLKPYDVYGPDRRIFCWILRVYLRIHILAGWTLTTLLVASLTGLVQR